MKNTFEQCFYTVAVILLLTMFTPSVYADVTATGDVDPGDPSLWDYYYNGYIGKITNGTLTVTDGSQIYGDNNGYIGYDSGSTGQVTIDGADSFWRNDNCFYVGYSGNGVLDITDGGKIRSNYYSGDAISAIGYNLGSLGQVTVDGVGSEWNTEELFYVGYSGNGMLNITNGGKVSNGNDNTHFGGGGIGYNSGSTGQVTVNGIGSLWDIRDSSAIVGLSGNGTLNITNGGQVNSIGGRIGNGSGSTGQVTVDGAGSIWHSASNLAPDFCVGYSGNGTLNITNGGQVNSGYADSYISYDSGSTGEVFVNGADSKWTGGHLFVGFFGNGLLEIANGGQVDSGGISIGDFGHYSGYRSTGQVIVDGADSELNAGRIDVGKSGNGTLAITRGGRVNGYDGSIARESGSTGQVTVDGVGSIWSMEGDLVIGDNDNYTSSPYYTNGGNGTLNIINGGQVNSSWGGASIGQGRNSVGKVTVDGVDSEWSIQHLLRIANGENSNGTLNITNGSQVSSEGGEIGYGFGTTGQVTVDGIGSAWNQGDLGLCLGGGGNGTLTITNGGYVSSGNGRIGDGRIGNDDGSAGSVTVDGAGSKWISERRIDIGGYSSGTLAITNGGQVSSSGGDINSGLTAVVTVDGVGSEWTNSGDFTIEDYLIFWTVFQLKFN